MKVERTGCFGARVVLQGDTLVRLDVPDDARPPDLAGDVVLSVTAFSQPAAGSVPCRPWL